MLAASVAGVVLVIGESDTGKTTLCKELLHEGVQHNLTVAWIEANCAHCSLSAPGCIGLAMPEPGESVAEGSFQTAASAFVGALTPTRHVTELIGAIGRLMRVARSRQLIVVEMDGFIRGPKARRLHQAVIDTIAPAHIFAMQHGNELSAILAGWRRNSSLAIHEVRPSPDIVSMPASFLAQRRAIRFSSAFSASESELHSYPFDSVAFEGTWLGSGEPSPPHMLRYLAGALAEETQVYYAETYGNHLGIMVSRPVPDDCAALTIAMDQFYAGEATITRAPILKYLVVGLETSAGKLLGIGRIEAIDFKRRTLGVRSLVRTPAAVSTIRFGSMRVDNSGEVFGLISPGEI